MDEKRKSILYVGNNLVHKTKYTTTMETLSKLLSQEKFIVYKTSSKINKVHRLIDMCFSVLKYQRKIDYIIIDTYSTSNFYYALIIANLARLLKIKYIPVLHGGNLPQRLDNSKRASDLIFKNSYKNISPSEYLKYEFEKRGYFTTLIPNVISIENYTYTKRTEIKPKLLYVRAFAEIYNPSMAIEVLFKIKKHHPNATLCMVGPDRDGSLKHVKALVKKLNLEDSAEFTGVLSKKEWHKKSKEYDVFINTTNIDNTPVSVIEAMALGIPIVSTDVGGLTYLIENNVDGVLVPKESPIKMSDAIIKLIKENNQSLASNARKKAETFGWDVVKIKWLELLK
jgi:glycosyltransferase involved in cell wall biosynthesis